MALSFNCGQYEQAFNSKRLQNWEVRNVRRQRPATKEGFTEVIANNRGHILPSIPRSARSPWGTFVGTWDLPKTIPGNKQLDPTARSADAHYRQMSSKKEADNVIYGKSKFRRPVAGQPVDAMPCQYDPSPVARSGAKNPQLKGSASKVEPVMSMSPTQPPLNANLNAATENIPATVPQELVYSYTSQPLPNSPSFNARLTPPQLPSARATPHKTGQIKPASARGSPRNFSPVRLSPVNPRLSSPLQQMPQSRQGPLTPNIASPKPASAIPKPATPQRAASNQDGLPQQQPDEAPVPMV